MSEERKRGPCHNCSYYMVHDIFGYMGLCKREGDLVIEKDMCENYRPVDIDELKRVVRERGWIYCATCKEAIYTEEGLEGHLGDVLIAEPFGDDVAYEEAPSAD